MKIKENIGPVEDEGFSVSFISRVDDDAFTMKCLQAQTGEDGDGVYQSMYAEKSDFVVVFVRCFHCLFRHILGSLKGGA